MDNAPPVLFGGDRAVVPAAKEPVGKESAPLALGSLPSAGEKSQPQKTPTSGETRPVASPSLEGGAETTRAQATLEKLDTGEAVLVIQAAWKELRRPSLQIMLVTDPKADLAKLKPIGIDGVRAQALWEEQVGKINKPVFPNARDVLKTSTAFLEFNGAQWVRVRARGNSLGRAAAYAVEDKQGMLLTFYLLDRWADDQGAIRIAATDLDVVPNFAQSGRLKIWLLGEEKVVASVDTVSWPGKPAAAVVSQPGKDSKSATSASKPTVPEAPAVKSATPFTGEAKKPASSTAQTPAKPAEALKPPAVAADKPATPPKKAEPSKAASTPVAKPAPPVSPPKPAKPAGPPTLEELLAMNIADLANTIERVYGSQMNATVRKHWQGGVRNYFESTNPEPVRRDVFMTLVRACWKEQQPGDLRNAFAVLYQKLKGPATPPANR
jgi:hypothetical protein